jgi:tRNA pseudouridine55 synthase
VAVTVHHLELTGLEGAAATLVVECSAGFYVRSLAHDLGVRLGVGAHLAGLRRTESAGLTLAGAITLEVAESREAARAAIIPLERMLTDLPSIVLSGDGVARVTHGQDVRGDNIQVVPGPVRLFDQGGQLVGIGIPAAVPGFLHPSIVLR